MTLSGSVSESVSGSGRASFAVMVRSSGRDLRELDNLGNLNLLDLRDLRDSRGSLDALRLVLSLSSSEIRSSVVPMFLETLSHLFLILRGDFFFFCPIVSISLAGLFCGPLIRALRLGSRAGMLSMDA